MVVSCGQPQSTTEPKPGPSTKNDKDTSTKNGKDGHKDTSAKTLTPELKTTAEDLVKEVMADKKAAADKYSKDKVVEVERAVRHALLTKGIVDTLSFSLCGGKGELGQLDVQCYLKDTEKDKVSWLGKGQKVSVIGKVIMASPTTISLNECTVTEKGPNPTMKIAAEQLAAEFAKDEKAAKEKYGVYLAHPSDVVNSAKEVIVEGTVADLLKRKGEFFGEDHLAILAGSDGMTVTCNLDQKTWESLKKGDKVTIKGEVDTILNKDKKAVKLKNAFVLKKG